MAYTDFEDSKPVDTDTEPDVVDDTRNNLMALRDMLVMGAMPGWDMAPSGGTAAEPAYLLYSKNDTTEAIKAVLTWSNGNVTQIVFHYSTDDFSASDETIGTESITYDASDNVTAITWS